MYKKIDTDLNFVPREEEVLSFWHENVIFEKSQKQNEGNETFTFYDGPPTANGKPHIGHILTRVVKDIIPRHRAMKGYDVLRKAGWDTHGLPVELEVEKQLGLHNKQEIEEYGVEKFVQKCKESVWKYKGEWERMSDRVGYWMDMEDPYVTYENNYIESEWWALKTIFDAGLLYKGHKIVPYCPRCGTSLSSHEVAQGYKTVVDTTAIVRFRAIDDGASFLAWTTTPWTLPSNVALCVNPEITYVKARKDGENYILAQALCASVLGEDGVEILASYKGADLVGKAYEPLFPYATEYADGKTGWYITAGDYVTLADGTGIVHIAPPFGEDDSQIGKKYDLPFVQLVNPEGKLIGGTPWDGISVKEADPLILEALREKGLLFSTAPYEHNYPFCWRCDTPLIYYARASWFIEMTKLKDKMLGFNQNINWLPENIKNGRMGNFLENVIDWGLSRERYWGTPLPIWVCDDCKAAHAVGSIEELKQMGHDVPDDIELHKPYIDRVELTCPHCQGTMRRVPEVIDGWFDSGAMPFAQWHYPFENQDVFDKRYPANFISEAIDQTRGWFYTLLAISTLLADKFEELNPGEDMQHAAFENCIVMGHVQDQEGRKMSKHIGNVVDPWTVLDVQGADAVRWYFYTSSMPWMPSRFGSENVSESQRKFQGTYWNTYAFYVLYAQIDKFNPSEHTLKEESLTVMDRWVLSRLHSTIAKVDTELEQYHITEAARAIQAFVDELSNWYVRRGRSRYWGSKMDADKKVAYMTLYTVLETLGRLAAPFVPFMTESIYQNIVRPVVADAPESVHLCKFPTVDTKWIDESLEENMDKAMQIVVLGRAARSNSGLKNRQPLSHLYVTGTILPEEYVSIVAEELNVKSVVFTDDASAFTTYSIKPQLKTMGPKYGKLIGKIGEHLKSVDGNEYVAKWNAGETISFVIDDITIDMQAEDALTEMTEKAGFVAEADQSVTVVLDTNLTKELLDEGNVREIVSKLQTMRKEAGFDVTDNIAIGFSGDEELETLLVANKSAVCKDTLALQMTKTLSGYQKEWKINGKKLLLSVEKSVMMI